MSDSEGVRSDPESPTRDALLVRCETVLGLKLVEDAFVGRVFEETYLNLVEDLQRARTTLAVGVVESATPHPSDEEIEEAWQRCTYSDVMYTGHEHDAFKSGYRAARELVVPSPQPETEQT